MHARLFGRLEPSTGIAPFGRLVDQFMAVEPYRSAERVFLIVDNGTSHRGPKSARRLVEQYPNLVLVHLPVHASWLDQIEIYFSIVQRKVLTPSDSLSLDELGQRILDFQARYEKSAVLRVEVHPSRPRQAAPSHRRARTARRGSLSCIDMRMRTYEMEY